MEAEASLPLKLIEQYRKRYGIRPVLIDAAVPIDLSIVVVIPAHQEEQLLESIRSLAACNPISKTVEVIIVLNKSSQAEKKIEAFHMQQAKEIQNWFAKDHPPFNLFFIQENQLEPKHAGVGLARKIGMDEATYRLAQSKAPQKIICCFDADSRCSVNYLIEVENFFKQHPAMEACSIHFEHPLRGNEFDNEIYDAISWYELHLRYYKEGLAFAQLPFAIHTIGSSMAVRALAYVQQGGMNKRKAGEDFYFLQKYSSLQRLGELNTATVFPSPRVSQRVPFGTGRAILETLEGQRLITRSYHPEIFRILKQLTKAIKVRKLASIPESFVHFIGADLLNQQLSDIKKLASDQANYEFRFFQWFNAFQALKYIHYIEKVSYPKMELKAAIKNLLSIEEQDVRLLLDKLRKRQLN